MSRHSSFSFRAQHRPQIVTLDGQSEDNLFGGGGRLEDVLAANISYSFPESCTISWLLSNHNQTEVMFFLYQNFEKIKQRKTKRFQPHCNGHSLTGVRRELHPQHSCLFICGQRVFSTQMETAKYWQWSTKPTSFSLFEARGLKKASWFEASRNPIQLWVLLWGNNLTRPA